MLNKGKNEKNSRVEKDYVFCEQAPGNQEVSLRAGSRNGANDSRASSDNQHQPHPSSDTSSDSGKKSYKPTPG